ncbi:hypothetical protein [Amycolatopsis sp. NPDC004169]|uniref:hypothetical protein n=1 Tax=Amycolatopsis sp. NPDC004169 TaxID=3154453 RepID=UPI0033B98B24
MSSTAIARRDAPARPALTPGDPAASHARVRAPRPWTASLQRPAAKILVAGGLTLAGWLVGAALSGSTASAADRPVCAEAPVVSTVDQTASRTPVDQATKPLWHARHRKGHHESACSVQPKADTTEAPADEPNTTSEATKDTPATDSAPATKATSSESTATETPKASSNLLGGLVGGTLKAVGGTTTKDTTAAPAKATPSGGGLVGGLVGGVLNVVGGTLTTVTDTLGTVTDTLSHTVLAPLTQPPANNPNAPVLLPLDQILDPVFGSGSNSGGATAVVPGVTAVVTPAPAAVAESVPAAVTTTADQQQTVRFAAGRLLTRHAEAQPAGHEQPRDSGTHVTGGGDSSPGLPGSTPAPSAPAPTAAPGHDGPGGARHTFAVHTDDVTTTQLKLIGTSRDHEVDGAGREAALPTTSPD